MLRGAPQRIEIDVPGAVVRQSIGQRLHALELRQVLDSSDVSEIRAKTEALQEASHKLAEAVYATDSAQQQQTAASGGDGASTSDDEVVEEADYEVIDEEEGATKS